MRARAVLSTTMALAFTVATTAAAEQYVYPARGQGPKRQARDEAECSAWAVRKSGFDPSTPAPPPAKPDTKVTGSGARAAGAVGGAAIAGLSGGHAGTGALAGAAAGGLTKRALGHRAARKENEAREQQRAAGQAAYDRARAACLTGRGYTVK